MFLQHAQQHQQLVSRVPRSAVGTCNLVDPDVSSITLLIADTVYIQEITFKNASLLQSVRCHLDNHLFSHTSSLDRCSLGRLSNRLSCKQSLKLTVHSICLIPAKRSELDLRNNTISTGRDAIASPRVMYRGHPSPETPSLSDWYLVLLSTQRYSSCAWGGDRYVPTGFMWVC